MKTLKLFISSSFLVAAILALSACGGGSPEPQPESEKTRVSNLLTSGAWTLSSLTVDGVAKSSFIGMTLTFNASGFVATNAVPVWPASGTWSFTDDTAKAILRNDNTTVDITSVDANNLTLSLSWTKTTVGPGRIESVPGKHVFVMKR